MPKLTQDEIETIAENLNSKIGNLFFDELTNVLIEEDKDPNQEISDEEIKLIKDHLKSII